MIICCSLYFTTYYNFILCDSGLNTAAYDSSMAIYFYMVRTFHMKHAKNRALYIILKYYLDIQTTFFLNKTSTENEVQGVLA